MPYNLVWNCTSVRHHVRYSVLHNVWGRGAIGLALRRPAALRFLPPERRVLEATERPYPEIRPVLPMVQTACPG